MPERYEPMTAQELAASETLSAVVRELTESLPAIKVLSMLAQLIAQLEHIAQQQGMSADVVAGVEKANRDYGLSVLLGGDTLPVRH